MKTAVFSIALLMGTAAIAQTPESQSANDASMNAPVVATNTPESATDSATPSDWSVPQADQGLASDMPQTQEPTTQADAAAPAATEQMAAPQQTAMSSDSKVEPGNASPERDARGIAVISDAATVPAGWNGVTGNAEGGPLLDPATGEPQSPDAYPACTEGQTDKCLQKYERGRAD